MDRLINIYLIDNKIYLSWDVPQCLSGLLSKYKKYYQENKYMENKIEKIRYYIIGEKVLSKELTRSHVNIEINHIKVEIDKG